MGHITHHAIVVTSWKDEAIESAHAYATEVFACVTPIIASRMNDYKSFLIPPDGSKSGWPDSDEGDSRRSLFQSWMRGTRMDDGGNYLEWVEVQYSSDDYDATVTDHEWSDKPRG